MGLDAIIVTVILPELHQCLLSIFLSGSNNLGEGFAQIALKTAVVLDAMVGSKRWSLEGEIPL